MKTDRTICLLSDSFPPEVDGVANATLNYAEQIHAGGSRAIVIAPSHPQADDSVYSYPVLRYPSVDIRKRVGYMAGIPFSPKLANRLSGENIAVLHSHCPIVSTLLARQLRKTIQAPLILTYHTKYDIDIANVIRSKALQTTSKKALLENINACDEVWTVSRGGGENLRAFGYEGEYIVMPNGVDLPRERVPEEQIRRATEKYDLPDGVPVYLFVGRIMWYKGIRIILDALARLNEQGQDFRMVFVGDGSDRSAIEQYADDNNLHGKCIFTGILTERDALRAWYCKADLFLFPSTFDTNGLVVREAAACSLASVVIKDSCAAEGVTDARNGFLIEENAESLCACLSALQASRDKMREIGLNAGRELYISWETAVRAASDRYEIVIDRYKSGGYPLYKKNMEGVLQALGGLMGGLGHFSGSLKKRGRKIILP